MHATSSKTSVAQNVLFYLASGVLGHLGCLVLTQYHGLCRRLLHFNKHSTDILGLLSAQEQLHCWVAWFDSNRKAAGSISNTHWKIIACPDLLLSMSVVRQHHLHYFRTLSRSRNPGLTDSIYSYRRKSDVKLKKRWHEQDTKSDPSSSLYAQPSCPRHTHTQFSHLSWK